VYDNFGYITQIICGGPGSDYEDKMYNTASPGLANIQSTAIYVLWAEPIREDRMEEELRIFKS
jgi:hypothetical protein